MCAQTLYRQSSAEKTVHKKAANQALIHFLAETLGCSRSAVQIIRGQTSRHKTVAIAGVSAAEALARRKTGYETAEEIRYNERSSAERVNSSVKDNYGGRIIRVRGHAKVFCHLMFGILAQTAEQLMRLVA